MQSDRNHITTKPLFLAFSGMVYIGSCDSFTCFRYFSYMSNMAIAIKSHDSQLAMNQITCHSLNNKLDLESFLEGPSFARNSHPHPLFYYAYTTQLYISWLKLNNNNKIKHKLGLATSYPSSVCNSTFQSI